MRLSDHLKAGHPLDVRTVKLGLAKIVVDDQGADHRAAPTCNGTRTVKCAPPSLVTLTSPPLRRATCRTRASPKPRRFRLGPALVLKPSWKIWPSTPAGIPAPESCTLITSSPSCSLTETLTQRSLDAAAASRAL